MSSDNEQPIPETLDVGNDSAAILQESIEPMRVPAIAAGVVGGTVLLVIFTAALVHWIRGRQSATAA
jgi:hypothetical protein